MEQRNLGTKGKSPQQDLTSTKDLTIELSEGQKKDHELYKQITGMPGVPPFQFLMRK